MNIIYQTIKDHLSKGRGKYKLDRPAGNNTRFQVYNNNGAVAIKLHNTHIVIAYPNNTIELNTGGWQTITTRDRMNNIMNLNRWQHRDETFQIYQKQFIWYLEFNNQTYLYEDHMILDYNDKTVKDQQGNPINPYSPEEEKKRKKFKRSVDKFVNKFIDKFMKQEINQPGNGDCFICQAEAGSNQIEVGTLTKDEGYKPGLTPDIQSNHILSHMNENYFVPQLLMNAIKENDNLLSDFDKHIIGYLWNYHDQEIKSYPIDFTKDRLKKVLKRYINKRVGLGLS